MATGPRSQVQVHTVTNVQDPRGRHAKYEHVFFVWIKRYRQGVEVHTDWLIQYAPNHVIRGYIKMM